MKLSCLLFCTVHAYNAEVEEVKYTYLATGEKRDTLPEACQDLVRDLSSDGVALQDECERLIDQIEPSDAKWYNDDWTEVEGPEIPIKSRWYQCSGTGSDQCFGGDQKQYMFTRDVDVCNALLTGHEDHPVLRSAYPIAQAFADCKRAIQEPGTKQQSLEKTNLQATETFCVMDSTDHKCSGSIDAADDAHRGVFGCSCKKQQSCPPGLGLDECLRSLDIHASAFDRFEIVEGGDHAKVGSVEDIVKSLKTRVNNHVMKVLHS